MADQPKGLGKKDNLADWKAYSDANSVNYRPIKAQSKRDLSTDDGPKHEWDRTTGRCPRNRKRGRMVPPQQELTRPQLHRGRWLNPR